MPPSPASEADPGSLLRLGALGASSPGPGAGRTEVGFSATVGAALVGARPASIGLPWWSVSSRNMKNTAAPTPARTTSAATKARIRLLRFMLDLGLTQTLGSTADRPRAKAPLT